MRPVDTGAGRDLKAQKAIVTSSISMFYDMHRCARSDAAHVRYVRTAPDDVHSGICALSFLTSDKCIYTDQNVHIPKEGVAAFPALSLRVKRHTAEGLNCHVSLTEESCIA